jgi:hypothetical protein
MGATDTIATATALASNGTNCSAGTFPLGVDAFGAVESCTDVTTQTELDTHAALTTAHGATSVNTASRIVQRDASGNFAAGTITATLTGNASSATALTANGSNCAIGTAPLGVDASGAVESCTDITTQTELDTHATLTTAHSATSTNTPSRIVLRDSSGNFAAGTITATLTGTASNATALVANGSNCASGTFPLGVDASGVVESCTDAATQSELDVHAALTTAHSATTANTPDRIVLRNSQGGTLWESATYTIAALPTCNAGAANTYATATDGLTATDCTAGGGGVTGILCKCDGTNWNPALASSTGTLQQAYNNSLPTPTIVSGSTGLTLSGFNSLSKPLALCNSGPQCKREYIDESGQWQVTFDLPIDLYTKIFPTKVWGIRSSANVPLLTLTDAGVLSGPVQFQEECRALPNVSAASDDQLFTAFQQNVTITSMWCTYQGTAPTTPAVFALEDGSGTALTHAAPVCSGPAVQPVAQPITAAGALPARKALRFDVTNTPNPNPTADTYLLCVAYVLDS